jgi:hypothetical protein
VLCVVKDSQTERVRSPDSGNIVSPLNKLVDFRMKMNQRYVAEDMRWTRGQVVYSCNTVYRVRRRSETWYLSSEVQVSAKWPKLPHLTVRRRTREDYTCSRLVYQATFFRRMYFPREKVGLPAYQPATRMIYTNQISPRRSFPEEVGNVPCLQKVGLYCREPCVLSLAQGV